MKPIYNLMAEHRLIERLVKLLVIEIKEIETENKADVSFISKMIDFLKIYADQTHHGKEEEILFKQLMNKKITKEHRKIVTDLIADHNATREAVKVLAYANDKYSFGNKKAIAEILENMKIITSIYLPHIEKEDKLFFIPSMDYFTSSELESMQKTFFEFDRLMIHRKYRTEVELLENR